MFSLTPGISRCWKRRYLGYSPKKHLESVSSPVSVEIWQWRQQKYTTKRERKCGGGISRFLNGRREEGKKGREEGRKEENVFYYVL